MFEPLWCNAAEQSTILDVWSRRGYVLNLELIGHVCSQMCLKGTRNKGQKEKDLCFLRCFLFKQFVLCRLGDQLCFPCGRILQWTCNTYNRTPHLIRMRGPPCFPPITSHNMNCKILKPAIYRGEAGTQRNPLKSPQTIFSASVAPVYFACLLAWPTIAKAHFQHILNHVQKLLHSNCIMLNKNAKAGK